MKLEVGAGKSPTPGYTHQDIAPGPCIEIVRPAWDTGLEAESVEEVYSRHFLEHLRPPDADRTMVEWMRVLKSRGHLHIIVPNLAFHAQQLFRQGQSEFVDETNCMHAMYSIYGWPGEHMEHKWGYTRDSLWYLLQRHGFLQFRWTWARECDLQVEAWKQCA